MLVDSELGDKIDGLFEEMNEKKSETNKNLYVLPKENRILLGSVLKMLHDAVSKEHKRIEELRGMASTLDAIICPVNPEVKTEMTTARRQQYPVLSHMIEAWGGAVILDSDYNFFDRSETWLVLWFYFFFFKFVVRLRIVSN